MHEYGQMPISVNINIKIVFMYKSVFAYLLHDIEKSVKSAKLTFL